MADRDAISEFMSLPQDKQLETLSQLPQANQDSLLAQVKNRRSSPTPISMTPEALAERKATSEKKTQFESENEGMARQFTHRMAQELPMAGGVAGGALGHGLLSPLGAVIGGAAGEFGRQSIDSLLGFDSPKTLSESTKKAATEGLEQGLYTLGGMGIARVGAFLKPISREARLSSGAALSQGKESLHGLVPEFDKTLQAQGAKGVKTIGEFEQVVKGTQERLENEYQSALKPIARDEVSTKSIADAITAKINSNMYNTKDGLKQLKILSKRAAEFDSGTWAVADLDLERSKVAKRFRDIAPSERAANSKLNANSMADEAANVAMNDLLYSMADSTGGKPAGYFKALKQNQSKLYDVIDDVAKSKKRLVSEAAQNEGRLFREKASIHTYLHPRKSIAGVTAGVSPGNFSDTLETANRKIGLGFPSSAKGAVNASRSGAAKALSSSDIDALPIRAFFMDSPSDEKTSPAGPKTKQLQDKSRELRQANQ
jgi:hypothetical protein